MKIFITGGSGFIGSHLIPALSTEHTIHSMQSDLLEFDKVTDELLAFGPDVIVHLGARTEVEKSFYEQITFSQINYVGTVNLIEAASKLPNLKNFVFASTMEVYGWQPCSDVVKAGGTFESIPVFDENTQPNPNAPYAVAKYGAEKYLEYANRALKVPYTVIRQTNTYGRKDNNFFVVEQVITQMLANPNEIKLGYSKPYRNFLYIDDMIDMWLTIIRNPEKVNGGHILTIGPSNALQIDELVDIIAKKIGWSGAVLWDQKPKRPGEIYVLNSGNKLITELTGWEPKVSLNDGLDLTIAHWKSKGIDNKA